MMKKSLIALFAASVVLSGCGNSPSTGSSSAPLASSKAQTATASTSNTTQEEKTSSAKDAFKKANGGFSDGLNGESNSSSSSNSTSASDSSGQSVSVSTSDNSDVQENQPVEVEKPMEPIQLFDNEYVTISFSKVTDKGVVFSVENKTKVNVTIQADSIAVNGKSTNDITMSADVAPLSTGDVIAKTSDFMGTDTVETISGSLQVISWDGAFDNFTATFAEVAEN